MMDKPEVRRISTDSFVTPPCRYGFYEPGNGTRYTAVAVGLDGEITLGCLGSVTDGWLVVSGNSGKAYLFQRGEQPLFDDYVRKHLGGQDGDYPYMGDLVRELIDRPGGRQVEAERYTEPGPSSWVGKKMMNPEGKVGTVVVDDNSVEGGRLRVLSVEFEDGTKEDLTLANVGPNPESSQDWKHFFEDGDEWIPWGP